MNQVLIVTADIAVLAAFLICAVAFSYTLLDPFKRARLTMTLFFLFIVVTLTISFSRYAAESLWLAVPAALVGAIVGHLVGVKAAQEKLMAQGLEDYMEHVAHVHFMEVQQLKWWSVVNVYSIAGALVLINIIGLSAIIFEGREPWALGACTLGAFLLGTVAPYLVHLWSLSAER